MIKAIYFDWGGVLIRNPHWKKEQLNKVLKPTGLRLEEFYPLWWKLYVLRSAGEIKTDEEFEFWFRKISQKEIPLKRIIEMRIKNQRILNGDIRIVKKLKENYKVGILSNGIKGWIIEVLKRYRIRSLFDTLVISSEVGVRKPNALIYYEALKNLSVRPEEIVFISDEIVDDLVAASGLGMKTIWLKPGEETSEGKIDKKILEIYKPDAIIKNFEEAIPATKKIENEF